MFHSHDRVLLPLIPGPALRGVQVSIISVPVKNPSCTVTMSQMRATWCRAWDQDISARLVEAGGDLLVDDSPCHNMVFESPAECFEVQASNAAGRKLFISHLQLTFLTVTIPRSGVQETWN